MGDHNSWMVYNGKSFEKWVKFKGTPISGNLHMLRLANLLHVHDQVLLRDGLERSMAFTERHRFVISGQLRSFVPGWRSSHLVVPNICPTHV